MNVFFKLRCDLKCCHNRLFVKAFCVLLNYTLGVERPTAATLGMHFQVCILRFHERCLNLS
jgi:hypothetical protein